MRVSLRYKVGGRLGHCLGHGFALTGTGSTAGVLGRGVRGGVVVGGVSCLSRAGDAVGGGDGVEGHQREEEEGSGEFRGTTRGRHVGQSRVEGVLRWC